MARLTTGLDSIETWDQEASLQKFPLLQKLAFEFLSIPATTAAVERLFSATGAILTSRRCKMLPATLIARASVAMWMKDFEVSQKKKEEAKVKIVPE